ncbi:hypothetical protein ABMA27_000899 [Loxostege sticticalis]|uniref:Serine protease K12H4.7 n=1 Tax=Loxostege sticticalis TaxID=481309 RepID=A0ABR3I0S5_LOXSC
MYLFLALCLAVLSTARAEPRLVEPPIRVDLTPPEESNSRAAQATNVVQEWITMPIDHFDPQNTDTYQMRFMYNGEFFGGPGSPVFIMIGGEWDIAPGWLRAGNMYAMAQENRGFQIYTEHRFYGESLPYQNFTVENLRFLNVDQALADLAYFIRDYVRAQPRFADSKIIMYGGSYAANMALWFKQRYPHLAVGVVASSGPIKAQIDFTGYLEVVHEAFLLEGGEQCISTIRQGIQDTVEALRTEEGRRLVEFNYRHCGPLPDYDDPFELGYFMGQITWTFSGAVQQARPGTLLGICENFRTNAYGSTPMEQIGGFIAHRNNLQTCWTMGFDLLLDLYSQRTNSRAWYYQTCTEYGFFQTAPRSGTVFDPLWLLNVDFYVEVCKRAFSEKFDKEFVFAAADRVNEVYGGLNPRVNNTINIHGYIDPWRALGVYDRDISQSSPTHTVPRASHCFDMQGWLTTDTIRMTRAQQAARRLVASWLA